MCDKLVELNLCDFLGSLTVLCWGILEPEAKGKISNTDPDFGESFDILFIIDFVCINFDFLKYCTIIYLDNWDFGTLLNCVPKGSASLASS